MWNKPKKQNWRQTLGFIKSYKKVSKEQYRKDMAEFVESHKKANRGRKREADKKAQAEYFDRHPFCEVCFYEGKGKVPAIQTHEVKYRSQGGKCVENNMISTCQDDHDRMHFKKKPYLRKDSLILAKGMVKNLLKDEITYGKGGQND